MKLTNAHLGGMAAAIKLRKIAVDNYYKNPNRCLYCGKIIEVGELKVSTIKRKKFCNHSCAAIYNNSKRQRVCSQKKYSHHRLLKMNDIEFINICNSVNDLDELYIKLGYKVKYDLKSLRTKALECKCEKVVKLIDAHSSKQRLYQRGPRFWQVARNAIRKHAHKTYNASFKPKECYICGYRVHIDVCHIKSVSSFPSDASIEEINHLDNLIALCPNHHWEFDQGLIKLDGGV